MKTAIVFDHRGRAHGKEEGPVELRFTMNRKAYYLSTGVRLPAEDWFSGAYADRPGWEQMERRINIIRDRLEAEINNFMASGEAIEPKRLKERVMASEEMTGSTEPFLDWAAGVIHELDVTYDTRTHYVIAIARLREFGGITTWSDLTPENILRWDAWLRQRPARIRAFDAAKGMVAPRLKSSTVNTYHKQLRSLIRIAIRCGRMERSPYLALEGAIKKGDRSDVEYLPPDDLKKIEECRPTDGSIMEVVRDLFLLQSYTGMSYSDLMAFDITKYRNEGGVWRASIPRKKTGKNFVIQLLPVVVEILEKYHMTVPRLDKSRYNTLLKVLGETLGIRRRLSSHVGRHTFGTMMLRQGVRLEHVQKMMGHSNITTTQVYAKVLAQDVYDDFERISKKK